MMLDQGEGRVQKRGERIRILRRGDTEWAGPGVEHWHGAGPDSTGHYFQTIVGAAGTYWMEEVGHADYMGNDVGITSTNRHPACHERCRKEGGSRQTRQAAMTDGLPSSVDVLRATGYVEDFSINRATEIRELRSRSPGTGPCNGRPSMYSITE